MLQASNEHRAAGCDRRLALAFDESKVDAIFADLDQCRLPGAVVGIAIGGKPVYRKGFGLASMELPLVLSPGIRVRIGSTSKHFTCLAYLLLCEEGLAGIDDPLGRHLPELHAAAHRITMRQLMGNTSGLRDAYDFCIYFSGLKSSVTSDALLALYREIDDVNAAPGTAWLYSNGGYELLRAAIERITGRTLEAVMQERIFDPLGMRDTLLHRCWDTDFVPNRAAAHTLHAGRYEKQSWMEFIGAGGILSTVDDMLRWLAHMDAPVVGDAATWALMKTPQILANRTSTGYGLGLMIDRYRGVETLHHPGGGLGTTAQMMKVPGFGLDIVVLANRSDVRAAQLANRILDTCILGLEPVDAPSAGTLIEGTFRSPTTRRVVQLFAREGRQMISVDGFDMPYSMGEDGVLRPDPLWSFLKRTVMPIGDPVQPASIRFSDFGNVDELPRAGGEDESYIPHVAGRYRCDCTGIEATISHDEEALRLTTTGRFGPLTYELECLANGIWRAKHFGAMPVGGVLSFDDEGGAFRFFSYSTQSLPFRRCA